MLSLEHNGLAYVADWSLYGVPSLRFLSLAHNDLLEISSTALVGLLELRHLDISHNNLTHLSELSLPPFPKLLTVDFRGNPIEAIFTSTFQVRATITAGIGSSKRCRFDAEVDLNVTALHCLVEKENSLVWIQFQPGFNFNPNLIYFDL